MSLKCIFLISVGNLQFYGLLTILPFIYDLEGKDLMMLILLTNIVNFVWIYLFLFIIENKTFGRKNTMIILGVISVLLCSLYMIDNKGWKVTVVILLLCIGDMILIIGTLFIVEVLETDVRVFGLGVSNVTARLVGGIGIYLFFYLYSLA